MGLGSFDPLQPSAMEGWNWRRRLGYGTLQATGLGFLAAGFEIVALVAGTNLPMSMSELLWLGLFDMLLLALFAAGIAAVVGLVHPLLARRRTSTAVAIQLALGSMLLALLFFGRIADFMLAEGEPVAAAAALSMPLGIGGMVYVNARWWLRRVELQRARGQQALLLTGGFACAAIVLAAFGYAQRSTGGERALEGDRNAILVTIDGLRHDEVPAALRELADGGVAFVDTVTPTPHSAPSNATVLTGVHPLRHGLLVDGDRLPRGLRTTAEVLAEEGYATGGFVSDSRVGADAGFSQGYRVFDDDFSKLAGSRRLALVRLLPGDAHRPAAQTVERFVAWLRRHHDRPFFAWVHLTQGDELEPALRTLLEAVEAHGIRGETLVVATGTHGLMRGEHGLRGAVGLYDPVIRVPLVMRVPWVEVEVARVEAQVRTLDVSATILDGLGFDPLGTSEGLSLLAYATGERRATVWCSLVGRDEQGRLHLGMRNNGVKYVRTADGDELLFDLRADPDEERSVLEDQQPAVEAARSLMASEFAAFETLQRKRGAGRL